MNKICMFLAGILLSSSLQGQSSPPRNTYLSAEKYAITHFDPA
jgi:hypothetical protein